MLGITVVGTMLATYIKRRFDESLKRRREKKLEEDIKAKEKFEASIKYYLSLPNSRTEAKLDLVLKRLTLVTSIIFGSLLSIILVMVVLLVITNLTTDFPIILVVIMIGYLTFCAAWWGFQISNEIIYREQIFSEIDERLRKKESEEPTKSIQ